MSIMQYGCCLEKKLHAQSGMPDNHAFHYGQCLIVDFRALRCPQQESAECHFGTLDENCL